MYHRRFEYMRYAKQAKAGLSLGGSGAPDRDLRELMASADPSAPAAALRLREAIGARYGVEADQVVLFVGASEANAALALAFVRPGDEVIVERPAYEALPGLVGWLGASVVRVDRRGEASWTLDFEELERAIGPRTRLIMLTHPHNPSGRPFTPAELARLRALSAERGVAILVDEIYRDDLIAPPPIAGGEGLVFTTSSLTKTYGLGPLRLGWAIGSPEQVRLLDEITDWLHVVPPLPSVALALAAWPRLDEWREEQRRAIAASRSVLERWRERTGLLPGPIFDGLAFYSAGLPAPDDRAFCARLESRGLHVPPGSYFEAPGTARIGFGRLDPARLERALELLEQEAAESRAGTR